MTNINLKVVEDFGYEWNKYDQSTLSEQELREIFDSYFSIFPWENLPKDAVGFDLGCGSGRWAKLVAPRVGTLHCLDPSELALNIAKTNCDGLSTCHFHLAGVDNIPLLDESMDFGYSLGVLHHVPDPSAGLKSCVDKLKPGAPFLLYIYYAFDNKPFWFRTLWKISDLIRRGISRMPHVFKSGISYCIASLIYLPLARLALLLDKQGFSKIDLIPLSAYRYRSFYTMRTDALDRFGTRLEYRFTAQEIRQMMQKAGLERIKFSESVPYWCAIGYKKA